MKDRDLTAADPKRLADVMSLGTEETVLWGPEELEAILRHQLAAAVGLELGRLEGAAKTLETIEWPGGPPIRTFADLFQHPRPPVALLKLTKRFARACKDHPEHPLPGKVAAVLYVASIVAARTRCETRISRMEDQVLRVGVTWAIQQPWVDEATRALLTEGLKAIGGTAPP